MDNRQVVSRWAKLGVRYKSNVLIVDQGFTFAGDDFWAWKTGFFVINSARKQDGTVPGGGFSANFAA